MKKPFVLFWLGIGGILIFSWVYLPTLSKYRDLKLQQDELDRQVKKLTIDLEAIREERDLLKNDREYLEKVIRDEMGLVKPGEIVYKFVTESPEPNPEAVPAVQPSAAPSAAPTPSPTPSGITVTAKPVASKPAPKPSIKASAKPRTASAEPQYPRRETR